MHRFFLILFALIVLLLVAAVLAPNLIPTEAYRGRVEQAASERLGRAVTLEGPISLRILPRIEARANDVTIPNADGFGAEPFAQMSELRLGLALGPLLRREIAIEEFVLVEPAIRLLSDGARNNWTFASQGDGSAPQAGSGRSPGALPFDARFGDVRLVDAAVSYAAPGSDWRVQDLDLDMDLPSLDAPVSLSGGFELNGERFSLDAELAGLRQAFEGARTPLSLALEGAPLTLSLDGAIPEGADWGVTGRADVAMQIRRFARLAGVALPDGQGFERFEAEGDLSLNGARAALSGARIRFDDISATGRLGANYAGARPRISGALDIPELNLNPYIPQSEPARRGGGGGWSEERIDLSPIAAIDGEITGRVGTLIANDIRVNDADLRVTFDRGVATASVEQFDLYDGRGFINARVDLRGGTPRFQMQGELDALDALPFLRDAADFEYLRGLGGMRFDLASEGASTAAIMDALNGEARFGFQNGAIAGVNIPAVIRSLERTLETRELPRGFGESQTTDFTELSGTVEIANGLARNLDLTMLSPLLRVQGQGEIDLAGRRIDYRLTPRAVETLAGQGGELDLQGVPIPIRVRGGFNDLSIGLDYEAIAQSLVRRRAGDAVGGEAGRVLREGGSLEDAARGALGEALRDALGGREEPQQDEAGEAPADGEAAQSQPAERERDPGRALLEGLLSDALGGGRNEEQSGDSGGNSGDPGGG